MRSAPPEGCGTAGFITEIGILVKQNIFELPNAKNQNSVIASFTALTYITAMELTTHDPIFDQ
jgi:hypothetical protein